MVGYIFIEQAEAVHDGHELAGLVMGQGFLQLISQAEGLRLLGAGAAKPVPYPPAYKSSRRRRAAQRTPVKKE